ncbi:SOS response-associated peptidase [Methanosphaerula palustris]|uniref:SOS response-associated peptidase n=1 Tax=Methanosphaerula palustris TaxID=475088 RepID=UPI0011D062E8|nr:SOS response-associated peptidase [Methanosphaerula palustris]
MPVRKSPGTFPPGRRASGDPRIAGTGQSPPPEELPYSLAVKAGVMTRHRSHGKPRDRVIWWNRSTATKTVAMIAEGGYLQWGEDGFPVPLTSHDSRPIHCEVERDDGSGTDSRGVGIDEQGPADRGYLTCTIITMEANNLVTPTHYRMPAIPGHIPLKRWSPTGS